MSGTCDGAGTAPPLRRGSRHRRLRSVPGVGSSPRDRTGQGAQRGGVVKVSARRAASEARLALYSSPPPPEG
eukprot:7517906-Heterocapsa_arctica.AAC.1